jgi:hypothetical protein
LWKTTQDKIVEIFPSYSITFENSDVFDYLDSIADDFVPPNILILQYILNELLRCCDEAKMNKFVDDLVIKIIDKMPNNSAIILNDINYDVGSKKIRTWFNQIFEKSKKTNDVSKGGGDMYRFTNPTSHTFGGIKHTKDTLLYTVPPLITTNYDVKQPCSSVQMIMFKTKNK